MRPIIYLQGGLGNQMFQYAFFLAIKEQYPNAICCSSLISGKDHNGYELKRLFNIKCTQSIILLYIAKLFRRLIYKKQHNVINLLNHFNVALIKDSIPSHYMPNLFASSNKFYTFFLGYWQTEKYFKNIENKIRLAFRFNENMLSEKSKITAKEIKNSNSVSIHVRRGDYLYSQYQSLYGNICTISYYHKAIQLIQQKYKRTLFFVFSDDIEWVKKNLKIDNAKYIDFNNNYDSWQDMYLMSLCKHNITANSSFSWWGAWLNPNINKTVICPSRFINSLEKSDIVPNSWIKI